MSPDLEILKSLNPDYVLSPNSLQSDLQPKYASIGVNSLFLNLRSVEGMYASIEGLGEKFGREEQAQALVEEYEQFMEEYRSQNEGKESPAVLVLMGLPGSYIVATESSYVGNLVKLAGGIMVYGDGDGRNFSRLISKYENEDRTLFSGPLMPCLTMWWKCLKRNLRPTISGTFRSCSGRACL